LGATGCIITPDDYVLGDLSPEYDFERYIPGVHSALTQIRLPRLREVPGTIAVLATLSQHFFAHWMLDLLPRIRLLEEAGFPLQEIDGFFVPEPTLPHQRESLAAAGLSLNKIIDSSTVSHIRATTLVVPSPMSEVFAASDFSCDYLRRLFPPPPATQPALTPLRRLFISRARTSYRRIFNEADVVRVLKGLGFSVVEPQFLTLREQAALFSTAETVIGPLGSALANFVYCKPGTRIVEILNPRCVQTCSAAICAERGLSYSYLLADGLEPERHPIEEDLLVDTDRLVGLLQLIEGAE